MSKLIVTTDSRGVATVCLNNPEIHNAFDDTLISELSNAFRSLHEDDSIRCVILASNGKSFSAGGDLNWMKRMVKYSYEENLEDAKKLAEMLRSLNSLNKPTIARVQGAAFGGAVGLVSCCDMAVGSHRASFCLSEVKIGLLPATIAPYVIAAIGERNSRRYFATAEKFDSASALNMGLLSSCVEESELDNEVSKFVDALLANSPKAVQGAKQLISELSNQAITPELIEHTSEVIAKLRVSSEGQEGLAAFLEKREPSWKN